MNEVFIKECTKYQLRGSYLLTFPKVHRSKYRANTFVFHAGKLWDQIPDRVVNAPMTNIFQEQFLKNWRKDTWKE